MRNKRQKIKDWSVRVNLRKMSKFVSRTFVLIFLVSSCNQHPKKGNADRFKKGVFEIPAGDSYGKTTITRVDSLQIEEFEKIKSVNENGVTKEVRTKQIDTLFIKWKNNFAYTLRMKNPKTKLDKDPIFVQINKVTDTSYDFTARVGYSNFKQKGTVFIKQ